ncbi:unnamed protein product [Candida verbasci]|uniref:DNA repair protein RAD4 n=1 Tax=Candida verbasci TaxID=1227364 RepID=A0A9W4TXD4_9ASCO|nr:unnamed protein product [Candida verbasci]
MNNDIQNIHYRQLLRQADKHDNNQNIRKKRKLKKNVELPPENDIINLDSSSDNDVKLENVETQDIDSDSDEFEDVSLDYHDDKSDGDSDAFEDVDLDVNFQFDQKNKSPPPLKNDSITIQFKKQEPQTKKVNLISSEERSRRVLMHKMYLIFMLIHGTIRNKWCNDKDLGKTLVKSCVTQQITGLLKGDDKTDVINSRRLLDGLKKLMTIYSAKFKVNSVGLIKKSWSELNAIQKDDAIVNRKTFKKLITNFRGSRDIGAQGFVLLLRGLGLNARLILSMQPPDYTILAAKTEKKQGENVVKAKKFNESNFPIFWVEVWDKFLKRWISVDPIVMQIIEICPKRRRCSFEPPTSDERNQLLYVIGYDKYGRVRDVTRRYSLNYNAKTIRKRIEFKSNEEKEWYERIVKTCNYKKTNSISDIFELKEFNERDLNEGMPNNIQSFKNHPLYVLETQINANEIIHPHDDSAKCGTFKSRNKIINVYKRSNVYKVRSAKAWYLKGRTLKMGQQPMKTMVKGEEEVRLYAEFQTQMYIPPPIKDGIVPKNQYGNIDLYFKTMLPENGVFIEATPEISMKLLTQAANILNIDYAKAIVAFDFGRKRSVNVREGGIVIFNEYKEAIELVMEQLLNEIEEAKRILMENSALNNWKYFLLKLRLENRLNKFHGTIEDKIQPDESDHEEIKRDSGDEQGGFIVSDNEDQGNNNVDEDEDGGFLINDTESIEVPDRKAKENKKYYDSEEDNNDDYDGSSEEVTYSQDEDMEFEYESE